MTSTKYSLRLANLEKLSPRIKNLILSRYPEIVPDILRHQNSKPFDPKEEIESFSYSIEGVTIIKFQKGKKPYYLPCPPDYSGDYSECYLNSELVLMEVQGEPVINRLSASLKTEISQFLIQNDTANRYQTVG